MLATLDNKEYVEKLAHVFDVNALQNLIYFVSLYEQLSMTNNKFDALTSVGSIT